MRFYLALFSFMVASGCQNRPAQESTTTQATETSVSADTLCYQQILKRDTTTLRLVTSGNKATGYLDIHPYEKDRARGPIYGTISGNQIRADWDRSGEGVTQTYALDLTLKADAVTWTEGERIKKQGVWVLKAPKSGYSYVLNKTTCP